MRKVSADPAWQTRVALRQLARHLVCEPADAAVHRQTGAGGVVKQAANWFKAP